MFATPVVAYCAVAGSRKEGRLLLRRRRHRRRRLRLLRPCWCLNLNRWMMLLWLLLLMLWWLKRMWMWGLMLRLRRLGGEVCMLGMDLRVSIYLSCRVNKLTCCDQLQGAVTGITRRIGAQAAHPVCPLESKPTFVLSAAEIPIVVVHIPGAIGAGGRFDLGSAVRPSRTADVVLNRVLFSGTFGPGWAASVPGFPCSSASDFVAET